MKKITREQLIRMEYVHIGMFGDLEIWAFLEFRKLWNPKTEEVEQEYRTEDRGRYQTKPNVSHNNLRLGKREE